MNLSKYFAIYAYLREIFTNSGLGRAVDCNTLLNGVIKW